MLNTDRYLSSPTFARVPDFAALGGAGTTPVFTASIVSYTTVCGLGPIQDLAEKAAGGTPASEKGSEGSPFETPRVPAVSAKVSDSGKDKSKSSDMQVDEESLQEQSKA